MTAASERRYVCPPCRIAEHGECPGNRDVNLDGQSVPVLRLRCGCTAAVHLEPAAVGGQS